MKAKFSVILNCYDVTRVQRHMTQQCMAAIRKYTDEPYELIIIDNEPTMTFYPEYEVYKPYQYIALSPKNNVYESYNLGASLAVNDKFIFIQNDVFVHEKALNILCSYLDEYNVCYPQQYPITRKEVKQIYRTKKGQLTEVGNRDAGVLAITREAFVRADGWDTRYHNLLGEKAFYNRIDKAGLTWTDRVPAMVTHIMAANNLSKPDKLYNKEMDHDANING